MSSLHTEFIFFKFCSRVEADVYNLEWYINGRPTFILTEITWRLACFLESGNENLGDLGILSHKQSIVPELFHFKGGGVM